MRQPDRTELANLLARPGQAVPGRAGPVRAGQCRAGCDGPTRRGQTELKNGLSGPGLTGAACLPLGRTDLPTALHCLPGLQRDIRIAGYLDISRYSQSFTPSLPFVFVDKCEDCSGRGLDRRPGLPGLTDWPVLPASSNAMIIRREMTRNWTENLQGRSFVFIVQTGLRPGTTTCWVKIVKKSYVNIYIKNI